MNSLAFDDSRGVSGGALDAVAKVKIAGEGVGGSRRGQTGGGATAKLSRGSARAMHPFPTRPRESVYAVAHMYSRR